MWRICWGPSRGLPPGCSSPDPDKTLLDEIAALLDATHNDRDYWVEDATKNAGNSGQTQFDFPDDADRR